MMPSTDSFISEKTSEAQHGRIQIPQKQKESVPMLLCTSKAAPLLNKEGVPAQQVPHPWQHRKALWEPRTEGSPPAGLHLIAPVESYPKLSLLKTAYWLKQEQNVSMCSFLIYGTNTAYCCQRPERTAHGWKKTELTLQEQKTKLKKQHIYKHT